MNRKIGTLVTCLALAAMLGAPQSATAQTWERLAGPTLAEAARNAIQPAGDATRFLVSDRQSLFVSTADGTFWERSFRIRGNDSQINRLIIPPRDPQPWYLLTTDGVFQSDDKGKKWKKIYGGIGKESNNVLSLARDPYKDNILYLGTRAGVFLSKDNGKTWSRAFAELSRKTIWDIVVDNMNGELFFAAGTNLYRYHIARDSFLKVFSGDFDVEEIEELPETIEDAEENKDGSSSKMALALGTQPAPSLFVGTSRGVYASDDEGETWQKIPNSGLRTSAMTRLVYSDRTSKLFAATPKGVFEYDSEKKLWGELYEGLAASQVFDLTIQQTREGDRLLAATETGVFFYQIHPHSFRPEAPMDSNQTNGVLFSRIIRMEPSVRDIQEAAIRYAHVANGKINRWHAASRLRALIPNLSFSKGLDIANNIHVDTASTTVADSFVQGPDDRDRSTDINLSWDLGEIIWSSAQTSIDSREKLMVELRDEILSEVTRLYFERRRAQFELAANPPQDFNEYTKALLRIEELTANLDALTNGYLSKHVAKVYRDHPDLARLWEISVEGIE